MKIRPELILLSGLVFAACSKAPEDGRKIKFYQSPMHPWVTSDKPGRCTICGMELAAVYEGEAGFGGAGDVIALNSAQQQTLQVATARVTRAAPVHQVRLAGTIEDDATRHRIIAAHFPGRVEKPFIGQVGEEVRAGQPLAEVYSPELLAVVKEAQLILDNPGSGLAEASRRRLVQFGIDPAQVSRVLRLKPDQFGIELLSPMDGVVIERFVNAGQYVEPGARLFEMGDFSRMWLLVRAYEQDLPWLQIGQTAAVSTPAAPGRAFPGIVTLIDANMDPASRSTIVRIEIPNPIEETPHGPKRPLPHRAYAEALIESRGPEALLVPRSAILDNGREASVFLAKGGGAFERRQVTVGLRTRDSAVITAGLQEGDEIAVSANLILDSESEMRRAGQPRAHADAAPAPPPPEPRAHAAPARLAETLAAFFAAATALSDALARDDLGAFNKAAPQTAGAASAAADAPGLPDEVRKRLRDIPRPAAAAPDLAAARRAFLPLAEAAADAALALRRAGAETPRVFACPMTASAFPGAPASARWVQMGATAQNPFFGARMLKCGAELQP